MREIRMRIVHNALPLLSSLSLHALILVIGIAAARMIVQVVPARQEQAVAADGLLTFDAPAIGTNPGKVSEELRKLMQDTDPSAADPQGYAQRKGTSGELAAVGGAGDAEPVDLVAIGVSRGKGNGAGLGGGDRWGRGAGQDGPQAAFGPRRDGGGRLFSAPDAQVRKVAYVCDASGSMISKMVQLRDELGKAIGALKPVQSFNVIFFQESRYAAWNDSVLQWAKSDEKRAALAFIDRVTPAGATDPISGLELAFRQQPQLIYLLTDGDFPDNKAVLRRINELNKDRHVRVNTIAFVSDADGDQDFIDILREIAKTHGGTFRHVRESELNR